MKRLLFLLGFALLSASPADAQRTKLFRSIIYTNRGERIDGILYDMTDSTVQFVPNQTDFIQQLRDGQPPTLFDVDKDVIDRIVIRRKGHTGRAALIGGGAGLVFSLGFAVAIPRSTGNGYLSAFENLFRSLFILAAPVGGVQYGTLISIIPRSVKRIRQNNTAFQLAKIELKRFSFVYQQQTNTVTIAPSN